MFHYPQDLPVQDMSILELNQYLSRPLKFFELRYMESFVNNPKEINRDYFQILHHLGGKFSDLSVQDIERLTRFILIGEINPKGTDIGSPSFEKGNVINIPRHPVFIDENLKRLRGEDINVLETIFQIKAQRLQAILDAEIQVDEAISSFNSLSII